MGMPRPTLQRRFYSVVITLCLAGSQPSRSQATSHPVSEVNAILPRTREGRERMRQVEMDVVWARVRVRGQKKQTLEERMARYHVRGLSIAVIRDYQIEWARGYGWADVEARRPATAATLFEPGSISKAINAAGVLALARNGRVDLHTDINRYLRTWKFPYGMLSKGSPITLAALLSHTAGLSVRGFLGYNLGDSLPSVPEILDGVHPARNEPVRSLFPAGVRYQYSGGGTMVAQQVVMDVTRQPYATFMREHVLEPLGMTSSSFAQPPAASIAALLATGYNTLGYPVSGRFPVMAEQAAAGLWTSTVDLARFLIDIQRALRGDSATFVTPAHARLMSTPALKGAPGLGLFVIDTAGVRYIEHGAGNVGMSGEMIASAAGGLGVVILQNGESGELLQELALTVARVYGWPGLSERRESERPIVSVPSTTLERYAGVYRDGDMILSIIRRGDTLWSLGPAGPSRMFFTSPTTFFNQESLNEKRFVVNAAGKVTALELFSNGKSIAHASPAPVIRIGPDAALRYVGSYRDQRNTRIRVFLRDGALWLDIDGAPRRMAFLSSTEFFTVEDTGVGMRFGTTVSGRVTGIWQTFGGERVFIRRESR